MYQLLRFLHNCQQMRMEHLNYITLSHHFDVHLDLDFIILVIQSCERKKNLLHFIHEISLLLL